MSQQNNSNPSTWRPWGDHPIVVSIMVITAILGGVIGLGQIFGPVSPGSIEYMGRVVDSLDQLPIAGAKVILDFQGVPQVVYTDSEGIFRFAVPESRDSVSGKITVEAKNYDIYLTFRECSGQFCIFPERTYLITSGLPTVCPISAQGQSIRYQVNHPGSQSDIR